MHCFHYRHRIGVNDRMVLKNLAGILMLLSTAWALTPYERKQFKSRTYVEHNTGLQGTVSVTTVDDKPGALELQSNGIPDHDTGTFPGQGNPNNITAQNNKWLIPKNPKIAEAPSCLPMGPIGMAVNGVAIYNPFTQTCCDAGTEELDLLDMCSGHPSPNGAYHYHIYPNCIADVICDQPSPILGVAFDGFPIYGPIDENGNQLTRNDLDSCNGRFDKDGNYKYHVIKEYPYYLGCYSGTVRGDSGVNVGRCQCTEPVEECTEFGGGGGTGGGGNPPPPPPSKRKRVTWASTEFTCCQDEDSCSLTRIFVPDVIEVEISNNDGNSASVSQFNLLALVFAAIASAFCSKFSNV